MYTYIVSRGHGRVQRKVLELIAQDPLRTWRLIELAAAVHDMHEHLLHFHAKPVHAATRVERNLTSSSWRVSTVRRAVRALEVDGLVAVKIAVLQVRTVVDFQLCDFEVFETHCQECARGSGYWIFTLGESPDYHVVLHPVPQRGRQTMLVSAPT